MPEEINPEREQFIIEETVEIPEEIYSQLARRIPERANVNPPARLTAEALMRRSMDVPQVMGDPRYRYTSAPFIQNNSYAINDYTSRTETSSSQTSEVSPELLAASREVYALYDTYHARIPRHPMTNHENDFFNNTIHRNVNNPERIVNSELPTPWSYFPSSVRQKIARERQVIGIALEGNNIHHCYCADCGRTTPIEYLFFQFGRLLCGEHVLAPDLLSSCFQCSNINYNKTIETIDGHQIKVCNSCLHRPCRNCGEPVPENLIVEGRCINCLPIQEGGDFYRQVSRSFVWAEKYEAGEIIRSPRTFSAEIEMVIPPTGDLTLFHNTLPNEAGIAKDGSISGSGLAVEVQTPRLKGKKGEECVARIASAIETASGKANKTCGLHVHIDGKGLLLADRCAYPQALVDFWRAHLVFEDVIKSFIPYQRRTNDYARSFGQVFSLMEIDTIRTLQDAERLWYRENALSHIQEAKNHHYHVSRYFGINFHPLFGDFHFEVRYHSGTTNRKKILEWANLHALIADAAVNGNLPRSLMGEVTATTSIREKTKMLFEAIGLAPRSQQYFFGRQNKFADKSLEEDNYN